MNAHTNIYKHRNTSNLPLLSKGCLPWGGPMEVVEICPSRVNGMSSRYTGDDDVGGCRMYVLVENACIQ